MRDETGQVQRVAPPDRIYGPGSGPIMAAFTHVNPQGSRFADGAWGVFYAGRDRATAIAETTYHHGRFLAATRERAMHLPMRVYEVAIDTRLHDLRRGFEAEHAPDDYAASRALGARLHAAGSPGVVYRSVRRPGGQCAGLFRPRGASNCHEVAVLLYAWDGARFSDIYQKVE
jgi:RES domain